MTSPAIAPLLATTAAALRSEVLPGTAGEKARQQLRSAALLLERLAAVVEGREEVEARDRAEALEAVEAVRALLDGPPQAVAAVRALLDGPPQVGAEGRGRVAGSASPGRADLLALLAELHDRARARGGPDGDRACAVIGAATRRRLDRWVALVPLPPSVGAFSPLEPVGPPDPDRP